MNEYKYNVENYEKEKGIKVTYDQPVQFLHIASSKYLACHTKEAKFENQNYKFQLDMYPSDATLFRIVPAFKFQKEGDQIIYASEVVHIVRQVPILNKPTYLHSSGELIKR
jgi:inositol 1,4,5-triphosphate receptor type 1/inositol 1,4,5-triphosphate receptor type 3